MQKLFSITKKDFEVQAFRAGGKGGQHQNKTSLAIRIIHKASGAVGECRNHRHQVQNKKEAFLRMYNSSKFQVWFSRKKAETVMNLQSVERQVDNAMRSENLKVEYL